MKDPIVIFAVGPYDAYDMYILDIIERKDWIKKRPGSGSEWDTVKNTCYNGYDRIYCNKYSCDQMVQLGYKRSTIAWHRQT